MFATEYPYLYYGVSISGWKNLLASYGYHFVSVETNGVNAFFINAIEFEEGFINNIKKMSLKKMFINCVYSERIVMDNLK